LNGAFFHKLEKLEELTIFTCPVSDGNLIYLKNIKNLCIYDCRQIYGAGFEFLKNSPYDEKLMEEDKKYVIQKLDISPEEFDKI
jgi:6-phosphogluconate dehydrogenase (decarboxylating)